MVTAKLVLAGPRHTISGDMKFGCMTELSYLLSQVLQVFDVIEEEVLQSLEVTVSCMR